MAQKRFYFGSTEAAPVSPAFTTWASTTGALRRLLARHRSDAGTIATGSTISWTTGQTALDRQFVSPPIAAQTISGTVTAQVRGRQFAADDNVRTRLRIIVVSNDGTVVRGTLFALGLAGPNTNYANSASLPNKEVANVAALTPVVCLEGDRLVVEIGYSDASGTTPQAASVWGFGTSQPELPIDESTTSGAGWIEFSNAIAFPLIHVTANRALAEGYFTPLGREPASVLHVTANRALDLTYFSLQSGPSIRNARPSGLILCQDPFTTSIGFTIASVLPRTLVLSSIQVRVTYGFAAPQLVYDGSAGGYQAGWSGTFINVSTVYEDARNLLFAPDGGFPTSTVISISVLGTDDLSTAISPPVAWKFLTCPPYIPLVGLTAWSRELGVRQARIALSAKPALGRIQPVEGALHVDGDHFVLNDGKHPAVTIEYDTDGFVSLGAFALSYYPDDDLPTMALRALATINAIEAPLQIVASLEPGGTSLALVHEDPGTIGNQPIVEHVADPGFVVEGLSGGVDGDDPEGIPAAPEGDHVFVLGYEIRGLFHDFEIGDFAEVSQEANFGSTKLLRVRAITRSTDAMPDDATWRFSLRIDDAEYVARTLTPRRSRSFVDLAANVSGLTGVHALAMRLELVSV